MALYEVYHGHDPTTVPPNKQNGPGTAAMAKAESFIAMKSNRHWTNADRASDARTTGPSGTAGIPVGSE